MACLRTGLVDKTNVWMVAEPTWRLLKEWCAPGGVQQQPPLAARCAAAAQPATPLPAPAARVCRYGCKGPDVRREYQGLPNRPPTLEIDQAGAGGCWRVLGAGAGPPLLRCQPHAAAWRGRCWVGGRHQHRRGLTPLPQAPPAPAVQEHFRVVARPAGAPGEEKDAVIGVSGYVRRGPAGPCCAGCCAACRRCRRRCPACRRLLAAAAVCPAAAGSPRAPPLARRSPLPRSARRRL